MSDTESDKDELSQEQNPENNDRITRKRSTRRHPPRRSNRSTVERYFKKILTSLNTSSSSSSNESSGDDDDGDDVNQVNKTDEEDSYESDEDDTDWSSASDQDDVTATNPENPGTSCKSACTDSKTSKDTDKNDAAIMSDSSDGTFEKCPICLLSFRDQEIGIPETCDHKFCFICIEEWAKNVSTCPIDRKEFTIINVKENYEAGKVVRKIKVQLNEKEQEDPDLSAIDSTFCEVCHNSDREDLMLLCDECNRGYHLFCLTPPLTEVPQGSWYCDNCFSSESSYSDTEVDALLEDVRDLGEPSTRLRTTVRNTPRITRTRQSERIRAAIIARTRYSRNPVVIDPNQPSTSSGFGSIIDAVNRRLAQQNRRVVRRIVRPAPKVKRQRKRKRRSTRRVKRQIIEYGLDQDANKFPMEIKKTRRLKKKSRKSKRKTCRSNRNTISRRSVDGTRELVQSLPDERTIGLSQLTVPKLHLFGGDQLDYFSGDDASDDESMRTIGRNIIGVGSSGGGTLFQTTSQTRIGSRRILNRQKSLALNINNPPDSTISAGPVDLLSSILDTQERWHSTRNLSNVRITEDGRLILGNKEKKETSAIPVPNPNDINEAPMYPRGGGGNNSGIGGTGRYSGGYNNNNRGGYYNNRGGGGHSSNYRSSTDGNYNGSNSSYSSYNSSGGYNQSNDFGGGGGSSTNFRGGRGRYPINNYAPRGGGSNPNTPINPNTNNNIRFKFTRRSLNLPNPSVNFDNDTSTIEPALAVQNEEITEGREIVSNSSNETIDSISTSEVIIDEIPTPSNIFGPPPSSQSIDEDRLGPTSSSMNSENIVSSSDQTDKVNNVEINNGDDEEEDDCPNFSVYSAVSMDIAKESENSSHEIGDATTAVNKDAVPIDGHDATTVSDQVDTGDMSNNNQEDDDEKEEDLVQLDDDEVDEETEDVVEEPHNQMTIQTKDDHPDDDDDDDGDDDDKKSAKETIPLDLNKGNLNKNSNNSSNVNNKKEKILELYDDSDWEEWNIDKNEEDKNAELQNITEPEVPEQNITDVPMPTQEKELTEAISEEDERSYTPCLDEKQQKPDSNKFNTSNESETPIGGEPAVADEEELEQNGTEGSGGAIPSTSGIGGLDTEMISDDDEEEIFNEETHHRDGHESKDGGGYGESNNKSKWIKRRDGNNAFKKISKNTKERNYRDKDKKRKRSRSRSNDKENRIRGMRKKDKRKDLERYNVRTIINERPRPTKDKYGRDLSARILKSPTRSKSRHRSGSPRHSRSSSRRRSPVRRSYSRRRSASPRRRSSSPRRRSASRDHRSRSRQRVHGKTRGKRAHSRSRSKSRGPPAGGRFNGGKPKSKRHRSWSSKSRSRSISKSRSFSISRSRTRTPIDRPIKQHAITRRPRKRDARRRELSIEQRSVSPRPAPTTTKRKKKTAAEKTVRRRRSTSYTKWSASRSKTPEISWTPPYQTAPPNSSQNLTVILKNKDTQERARKKKEKKRKERRKENERRREKKRQRADKRGSPIPPSKEVFASGNNILVSVSFNKNQEQPPQQTTVVTLPASRSQIVSKRRDEIARKARRERNKQRHRKIDMKPVAIIDLDRSPFKEMTPSPKDVIVLDDDTDEDRDANKENKTQDTQEKGVPLQHEEDTEPPMRVQQASQPQSPVVDDSFDLLSSGPKTPPEPPTVKFSMSVKSKNTKLRAVNPLHDAIEEEAEVLCERDAENVAALKDQNKIGPNTPPEPAPTSPDAYDPFEPTKSPSPSPSPAPPDIGDMSTNDDDVSDNLVESTQECINEDKRPSQTQEKILNPVELVMALINNKTASAVAASSSAHADITSTSGDNFNLQTSESQIIDISSVQSASPGDKSDDPHKQINVLSNVLMQTGTNQTSQSRVTNIVGSLLLPGMSNSGRSPIKSQFNNPTSTTNKSPIKSITLTKQTSQKIITLTQLPKITGITNNNAGGGVGGANISDLGGDDGGNDYGSPYSPGSSDYDDLFEPPMDTSSPPPILPPIRGQKSQTNKNMKILNNPLEMFDNLFGSTSPVNYMRLSNKTKSKQQLPKMFKKTAVKVYHKPGMGKLSDDQLQILDDLPSSAVELQVKDKFLRKLNRQERVVEEVKLVLKPHYNKKHVSKEEYKNIMRRAVPKICHNRTGEINPQKIQNLIEAYVKKYRHRRKILNNNAVSSSNKCVDFLNKLN